MDLPHPHQDLNDRLIEMLNDPSQSIIGTTFDRALLRELHQSVEVDQTEVEVGFPERLDLDGPVFRNRIFDAYDRLEELHKEATPEIPHVQFAAETFAQHARTVGQVGLQKIEVTSAEFGGKKIEMAATPAAIEYAAERHATDLVRDLERQVSLLPADKQVAAQQQVVKALFPNAEVNGLGEMTAGRMKDIRLKPKMGSLAWGARVAKGALFGAVAITETVGANIFIEAGNILESMTTPPGVQGPRPLSYHVSTIWRDHRERSQAHTCMDIMQASMRAEVLLRGCLRHEKGIAQPELDPARVMYLEEFLQRQHELTRLHRQRDEALRKASYNDQERVRRDMDAKIERWKREISEKAGLQTGDDMAFARKLTGTVERDPLIAKCLTDSVLGQPIHDRLQLDFVQAATSAKAPDTTNKTTQGEAA